MNRLFIPMTGFVSILVLATASLAYSQVPASDHKHKEVASSATGVSKNEVPHKSDMCMHESDLAHGGAKSHAEEAMAFKGEAKDLRAKAASHRKLAQHYRASGASGKMDHTQAAEQGDNLAKRYEDAAKEADMVSLFFGK